MLISLSKPDAIKVLAKINGIENIHIIDNPEYDKMILIVVGKKLFREFEKYKLQATIKGER